VQESLDWTNAVIRGTKVVDSLDTSAKTRRSMIGLINHANRDSLINFKDNEYALAKNKLQNKYSSVAKS